MAWCFDKEFAEQAGLVIAGWALLNADLAIPDWVKRHLQSHKHIGENPQKNNRRSYKVLS